MTSSGFFIAHRINSITELKELPDDVGVEIDIRFDNRTGDLYLNHDNGEGENLKEYLENYKHTPQRILIFNIKDTGTEKRCIELAEEFGIPKRNYFLLDCEFPYIYYATKSGVKEIAIRYSEAEPLEQALLFAPKGKNNPTGIAEWLWIDTNTTLPLDPQTYQKIKDAGFKTCLVCPERWGRPNDIEVYGEYMAKNGIFLDAVMTNKKFIERWKKTGAIRSF